MHFILTADNDLVVFRPIDPSSVFVAGAERSMGSRWKDGTYSVDESRRLWALICEGGGNVPSPESQKAISEGIGRSHLEQIHHITEQYGYMILDIKEGHKKDIRELEERVSSQEKTTDALRESLKRSNEINNHHDLKIQEMLYEMEKSHERELRDLMSRTTEILLADQAKSCGYEE